MDASALGNLDIWLAGLLLALVCWIYKRELDRQDKRGTDHDKRLNNHGQRLQDLDGQKEGD